MNIILVHGFLAFWERFGMEYFRGVAQHFRAKSLKVLVAELDPIRGIQFRAGQLREQIVAAHNTGDLDHNGQNHIIAHSMGGLDSRFMLSPVNPGRLQIPVRSLTTISTPHRGSPIADILDNQELLIPFPHLPLKPRGRPLDDPLNAMGTSSDGLRDLTTAACAEFSVKYIDNPAVAYFSVAGRGRESFPFTSAFLLQFYSYIGALTGELNDGLVSVRSAQWGTFDPDTWPADHAEEVGHNMDNMSVPPAFPYLAKYDQIVARVAELSNSG
jgi:triacylglycerol lipase